MRCALLLLCLGVLVAAAPAPAKVDEAGADKNYKELAGRLETARGAELDELKAELLKGGMPAHAALKSGPASSEKVRAELRRAIRARRDAEALAGGLVLHEWGAITLAQGTDRQVIGMQESASDLPGFVQQWQKLAPKREEPRGPAIQIDPVIWLYSRAADSLTVTLACPRGMLTAWHPTATRVQPSPGSIDLKNQAPSGGILLWKNFDLLPAGDAAGLSAPGENAWWWPICRKTDSAIVKMEQQSEKFLYYAGVMADAPLPIELEGGAGQKYSLRSRAGQPVRNVMIVNVSGAKAAIRQIAQIDPKGSVNIDASLGREAKSTKAASAQARDRLVEMLEEEGLFPKEAAAAGRIAERQWFAREGVRVLYLNPAESTASLLPIRCEPSPAARVRAMIIVHECLADSLDNVVKQLIVQLGDDSFQKREEASARLVELGGKALPAVVEAMKSSKDGEVRNRLGTVLRKIDPKNKALEELDRGDSEK